MEIFTSTAANSQKSKYYFKNLFMRFDEKMFKINSKKNFDEGSSSDPRKSY